MQQFIKEPLFNQLAHQGFNRVPLVCEVLADLETPLSAYLKCADLPFSYLFESVQGGEKWGRYSIIGLPAKQVIMVRGDRIQLLSDGQITESLTVADPLAWIADFHAQFTTPDLPDLPGFNTRFNGGLVGYFGYDCVQHIEPCLKGQAQQKDVFGTPDSVLMVSDEMIVFDNLLGRLFIVVLANPAEAKAYSTAQHRLTKIAEQLQQPINLSAVELTPTYAAAAGQPMKHYFKQADFEVAVERIKHYILDGDVMQVVLSQRMESDYQAPPLHLYRALRCINPSPYMFYLNMDDFYIVGSSPEILIREEAGQITVRPLAGTRPRGEDDAEDIAYEQELLADPKERAEHLMLIDLGRNDVGRVAKAGSVKVTEAMHIERYSHVMHIVSNVVGELKPDSDAMDALKATFPAGTLSGAPKVRAMEIIYELEPVKRGIYGGAVGYWAWNGNMDMAIGIRTAVIKDQRVAIQVGAGVVADSEPRKEWEETLNKAKVLLKALNLAESGLNTLRGE